MIEVSTAETKVIVVQTASLHAVSVTTADGVNTKVTIANGLPIPFSNGQGNIEVFTAGQDLSSGRLVYIDNGKALYFDPSDESLWNRQIGITKTAALNGAVVKVQLSGIFSLSGLGLTAGLRYYAGTNGSLITDPSALPLVVPIGHAIADDQLSINFYSTIKTI